MSVSEFQRHEVFKWIEENMGPERAAIMMDLLFFGLVASNAMLVGLVLAATRLG